jgi:DNA polymerase zeta
VQRQLAKVMAGRVPLRDFIFAKEVRLGTYSTTAGATLPPAVVVASKALAADPRMEPKNGERVRWVLPAYIPPFPSLSFLWSPIKSQPRTVKQFVYLLTGG